MVDRFDDRCQHLVQEFRLTAAGVLRAELDVFAEAARVGYHVTRLLNDLLTAHSQLVFAMDRERWR